MENWLIVVIAVVSAVVVTALVIGLVYGLRTPDSSVPGMVRQVRVMEESQYYTITWEPPAVGTPPLTYTLQIRQQGSDTPVIDTNTSQTSEVIPVSSLQPDITYEIFVWASNPDGTGPIPTEPQATFTTLGAPQVTIDSYHSNLQDRQVSIQGTSTSPWTSSDSKLTVTKCAYDKTPLQTIQGTCNGDTKFACTFPWTGNCPQDGAAVNFTVTLANTVGQGSADLPVSRLPGFVPEGITKVTVYNIPVNALVQIINPATNMALCWIPFAMTGMCNPNASDTEQQYRVSEQTEQFFNIYVPSRADSPNTLFVATETNRILFTGAVNQTQPDAQFKIVPLTPTTFIIQSRLNVQNNTITINSPSEIVVTPETRASNQIFTFKLVN